MHPCIGCVQRHIELLLRPPRSVFKSKVVTAVNCDSCTILTYHIAQLQSDCDIMLCMQVTLGITTLMTHVPASLGSAHQAGALTLFSLVLALMHSLRQGPSAIVKSRSLLRQYSLPLAAGSVVAVGAAVTLDRSQVM